MKPEIKLLYLGISTITIMLIGMISLQIISTGQRDKLIKQKKEITKAMQYRTELESKFASYTRGDILEKIVNSVYPNFETMSFNKTTSLDKIQIKVNPTPSESEDIKSNDNSEREALTNLIEESQYEE